MQQPPMQQHWKFKPSQPGDFGQQATFRRKRRNSEPNLSSTRTYKSFVTHWKLDSKKPGGGGGGQPLHVAPLVTSLTNPGPSTAAAAAGGLYPLHEDILQQHQQQQQHHMARPPFLTSSSSSTSTGSSPTTTSAPNSPQTYFVRPTRAPSPSFGTGGAREPPSPQIPKSRAMRRTSLPNIHDPYFLPRREHPDQGKLQSIPEFNFPAPERRDVSFPSLDSFSTFRSSLYDLQQSPPHTDLAPFLMNTTASGGQQTDNPLLPGIHTLFGQVKLADSSDDEGDSDHHHRSNNGRHIFQSLSTPATPAAFKFPPSPHDSASSSPYREEESLSSPGISSHAERMSISNLVE
eukprot:TRINITY_DN3333_c0_g1_i5.p1 TRINITY_DN3333_c0_g1~~TRINITY_DN3333_c0_g1_i5.p1  ORF type:complete len:347 (+),score=92.00 TRINITY_DN3333_c0_g1_i5:155-1195(+)